MTACAARAAAAFGADPRTVTVEPWGHGHIHATYRVGPDPASAQPSLLLQRVNEVVFPNAPQVLDTIRRVTDHLRRRLEAEGSAELDRRVARLVATTEGAFLHRDANGALWRAFLFVEGTRTHAVVSDPAIAHAGARAFATFVEHLSDLPPPRLSDLLPHFHDTPSRVQALHRAVASDVADRVGETAPEIDFALARECTAGVLLEAQRAGEIPERVTHNDTKIDNVLFDDRSGEALCVIDLDTVMPGLSAYDFGDLVRTVVSPAPEDETDLSQVRARPELFEALVAGWCEGLAPSITRGEIDLLALSGRIVTYEIAVRFLTDHLEGDRYFHIHRPGHNLDRARAGFALLRSLEAQAQEFERIVRRTAGPEGRAGPEARA